MASSPAGAIREEAGVVIVAAVGEIDAANVHHLSALMDEAVALGARRVAVDVANVGFLDSQALHILMIASERLRLTGAQLTVRAASEQTYRVFEATGLTEALRVEAPASHTAVLSQLVVAAAVPLTRDVLDAALKLVVTMAHAVIPGADGASITLPRLGRLGTAAASNDVVLHMDHDQYDTQEGPCLDAATTGDHFHIDSLTDEFRWPAFVPRARARGIQSILSTPLLTADRAVGALNLYSRTAGAFEAHDKLWADQFAAQTSLVLERADPGNRAELLTEELQQALLSREVIGLAQGVVMHRDGVTSAQAFDTLRELSRQTDQPLRDICALVAGSPERGPSTGYEDQR